MKGACPLRVKSQLSLTPVLLPRGARSGQEGPGEIRIEKCYREAVASPIQTSPTPIRCVATVITSLFSNVLVQENAQESGY